VERERGGFLEMKTSCSGGIDIDIGHVRIIFTQGNVRPSMDLGFGLALYFEGEEAWKGYQEDCCSKTSWRGGEEIVYTSIQS
jgi:hypothetical protein